MEVACSMETIWIEIYGFMWGRGNEGILEGRFKLVLIGCSWTSNQQRVGTRKDPKSKGFLKGENLHPEW